MSGATHNLDQEFWRPPAPTPPSPIVPPLTQTCSRCNTEFVMGARFCHVCGAERETHPAIPESRLHRLLDIAALREALGLTIGALVAFIVGIACIIAAIVTGFIYTATTLMDWQAVQIWRIEWLLAAAVAFIAGVLLNRRQ
jgi:hypothetical protein